MISNLKKHSFIAVNILLSTFLTLLAFGLRAEEPCTISQDHGQGYSTTISSVVENEDGSHTIVLIVEHDGSTGPGYKKMSQYTVEADPGTYSNVSVQALSGNFSYMNIDYGPNFAGCPFQGFRINRIQGLGNGEAASFSITYTLTGGLQDQQVMIQAFTVQLFGGFTESDFQSFLDCANPNIIPYYEPPVDGKTYDLIGSELTSLYFVYLENGTYISDDIFQVVGSSVSIRILTKPGEYQAALDLLISPAYGLTSVVGDPGENTLTGLFPILNLLSLNALPELLVEVRPNYSALSNIGLVTSQGDTALRSYMARTGFNVTGEGIKIGVISDSYNTRIGNPAADDVLRKDLPGVTNPDYPVPVDVVKEYPYGTRTDEGRAMLHIVHDVAPGAELAFRTGFLGPADFAQGIHELRQAGCDIIVDDITYISEPFFRDGIVAKAVETVADSGVIYFSAAGNFGTKSYQSSFYPTAAPEGITGEAHNFAGYQNGTDIYQNITVAPGNYTIVLQWDDGTPGNSTQSDYDIYLTEEDGSTLFGFNSVNTGGAALEVLPFTVVEDTAQTNIMIIRSAGSSPALLKYIIFRGIVQINEYATPGASTLVGQANAESAIAVGAVLYSNSPEYGVNSPTVASFSSRGGTPVNGADRSKPEITAPNGVNTNVDLGGFDIDGDAFPNFFGTSAAAPHAAGVAALIRHARQKYYGTGLSPAFMKGLLQNTAIDMHAPGYDPESGAGFIDVDAALGELANPKPLLTGISYDTTLTPGIDTILVTVYGRYLTGGSQVYFNGEPLTNATIILGDTAVSSEIPPFDERYPMIQVYNPPKEGTNGTDGGLSEPLYFTTRETIVISIGDQTKKYGEVLPELTAEYFVENTDGTMPLDSAGLTQEEIDRIHSIALTTIANSLSNAGLWAIEADQNDPLHPESEVPATDSLDISLLQRYRFDVDNGLLAIEKLDLVITPRDTSFVYGEEIGGFSFDFYFNQDTIDGDFGLQITESDSLAILSAMRANYATALVNATVLVNASSFLTATALVNKSMMISNATFNLFATALVNGTFISGPQFVTATALVNVVNFTGRSALAPATALVNGDVIVNGFSINFATALVNAGALINSFAGATALVNAETVNGNSNSDAIVIMGGGDISILAGDSVGDVDLRGISLITGKTVGQHYILPGSFVSNNFNISYEVGLLNIEPGAAEVIINTEDLAQTYNTMPRTVSATTIPEGLNVEVTYDGSTTPPVNAGSYTVIATVIDSNYVGADTATLVVGQAPAIVTADLKWIYDYDPLPTFTATFSGFLGSDNAGVVTLLTFSVSPAYSGAAGTYQIIPAAAALNYSFTPVNGPLYVNPNGTGTHQIKPKLTCVEILSEPDPSGFMYVANFAYENNNPTDVYIPVGSDNYFWGSAQYNGENQPVLFEAGGGSFTVPFNGNILAWTVKSFNNNGQKGTAMTRASSGSPGCLKVTEAETPLVSENVHGDLKVYPNPATGKLYVEMNTDASEIKEITVYDIYGKTFRLATGSLESQPVELDLSGIEAGIYLVRIRTEKSTETVRFIKN